MKIFKSKKIILILILIVLLFIAGFFFVPTLLDLNNYKGLIVSKIEDAVQGDVHVGHISWGISDGIWLRTDRFSITNASEFPVDLNLSETYTKFAILPLLKKRIKIDELILDGPEAKFRLEPGPDNSNISHELGKDALGALLPIEISIKKLSIQHGRISIEDGLTFPDEEKVHTFNAVEIQANDIIPGQSIAFFLSLKSDQAKDLGVFQAQGTFKGLVKSFIIEDPEIKLNVLVSSLNTEILKPYLKGSPLENKLGGLISFEIDYKGDLLNHFTVAGSLDLTELSYYDPSLWENSLPGVKTEIRYQAKFDPYEITLYNLALTMGNNTVNGRASIRNWREDPVIQDIVISSTIFPEKSIPMIPWKFLDKHAGKIRPVLEGGGRVDIETLTLKELKLYGPFPDPKDIIMDLGLTGKITDILIPPIWDTPRFEIVSGIFQFVDGVLYIKELKNRVASIDLPTISGQITNINDAPSIQALVRGQLNINDNLDESGLRYLNNNGIEKLTGISDIDLSISLEGYRPDELVLEGKTILRDVELKTSYSPVTIKDLDTKVNIRPDTIEITDLSSSIVIPGTEQTREEQFSLKLDVLLEDWRREPAAVIRNLSTSSISLAPLVAIIPWEQIGDKANLVKEILLAGGSLKIEELALPGISLKEPPEDVKKIFSETTALIIISDLNIRPDPDLPMIEGLTGSLKLDKGVLNISGTQALMGPVTFPVFELQVSGFDDFLRISGNLKGPIKVTDTENETIERHLRNMGLKRLKGLADVDINFIYDQQNPKDWVAKGSLLFDDISAESYPKSVHLDDLHGRMSFSKGNTTELTVEGLSAKINQSDLKLEGKLANGGTAEMEFSGKVDIIRLDLAEFDELIPFSDDLNLEGNLDIHLAFNIPGNNPKDVKLEGNLIAEGIGFDLPDYNTIVKGTNIRLEFIGKDILLNQMNTNINNQLIILEGSATNSAEPKINLTIKSPDLNLDQLLAFKKTDNDSSDQKSGESNRVPYQQNSNHEHEIPPYASKITADLRVEIDKGRYLDQAFSDLRFSAFYDKGNIQPIDFDLHLADGTVIITGSAQMTDPIGISFIINPDIKNVQLRKLDELFKVEKMPLEGPFSVNGRLEGTAGGPHDLLADLNGVLTMNVGEGRIPEVKHVGKLATRILTIINISGLLRGSLADDLKNKGISFRSIDSEIEFNSGNLNINNFIFISDSMNANSQGIISIPDEKMTLQIILKPLGTLDKILGIVPILGKAAQKITSVYIMVDGPFNNPKINAAPLKGLTEALKSTIQAPGMILKNAEELSQEIEQHIKGSKDIDMEE